MYPVGRLLFYRWPEKRACLADAPADVHDVAQRCSRSITIFLTAFTLFLKGATIANFQKQFLTCLIHKNSFRLV